MADLGPDVSDQLRGQLRLGAEDDVVGHAGLVAARGIVGPFVLRQIQPLVQQRVPPGAGVGQVDGHLAVVDLAGRPAVYY